MKTRIIYKMLAFAASATFAGEVAQAAVLSKTSGLTDESAAATRILKPGESFLLTTCAQAGDHPNADEQINAILAKGKFTTSGTEINPPYLVSAPGVGSAGNGNAGWSWCTTVTITKQ